MQRKPVKKRLIVDIGAGAGDFSQALKRRNPNAKVIAVDREAAGKGIVHASMGSFFQHRIKNPARVKKVWLNHVDIISCEALKEFKAMVKQLSPGARVMLTIRAERLAQVRAAIQSAGLEIKAERVWNPKMVGSQYTKKFYAEAQRGVSKAAPVRVVAVKPR